MQDTDRRHDTHKAAAHSNNRTEHAAMDGLPESVISPPTTEPPKPELESYTFTYPPAELPSSTPIDQDTAAASRGPPSPQTSELTALDPSPSSNTRVFNSTAQRYAAYRLRTATAGEVLQLTHIVSHWIPGRQWGPTSLATGCEVKYSSLLPFTELSCCLLQVLAGPLVVRRLAGRPGCADPAPT